MDSLGTVYAIVDLRDPFWLREWAKAVAYFGWADYFERLNG